MSIVITRLRFSMSLDFFFYQGTCVVYYPPMLNIDLSKCTIHLPGVSVHRAHINPVKIL